MAGRRAVRLSGRRSKYGATRTTALGISFHSKREADRYRELLLLAKAHKILDLRLQPRYTLCALVLEGADCRNVNAGTIANRRHPVGDYVADFEYRESSHPNGYSDWRTVVEDVKGVKTDLYKLKKRLFEAQYGISIRET